MVDDSRTSWLLAGQDLLRDGGFQAVKLTALSERTGLTTGSFYHHFSGMAEYLGELASYFGGEQPRVVVARLSSLPPEERLQRMEKLSVGLHMGALHRAMRDWATCNARAATAVREADHVLLEFIRDAFADLGMDTRGAELRAEVVYALAIIRLDTPWPRRSTSISAVIAGLDGTSP